MVYLTTGEKRKLLFALVGIVVILVIGGVGYGVVKSSDGSPGKESVKADVGKGVVPEKTPVKETKREPVREEVKPSFTQYDESSQACVYYYEGGKCFVPLSFCVPDASVKSPRVLDRERYCSASPLLEVGALQSEPGGACPFTASEGDLINLRSIVQDPDEADPTHPVGPLGRLDVRFSSPFADSNGVWQTKRGDVGVHRFMITVSDGQFTTEKAYCIEVKPGNRPPVLSHVEDVTVVAGEVVKLEPRCDDIDGDAVSLSYVGDLANRGWMVSNVKETSVKDVGGHGVTVVCTDARGASDFKSVAITVVATVPEVVGGVRFVVEPRDVAVDEGETVVVEAEAVSDSGKPVTVSYGGWMSSRSRQTSYSDAGVYEVTVTVSDGVSTVSKVVRVTVRNVNRPPVIVGTEEE